MATSDWMGGGCEGRLRDVRHEYSQFPAQCFDLISSQQPWQIGKGGLDLHFTEAEIESRVDLQLIQSPAQKSGLEPG